MNPRNGTATAELFRLFRSIGRASLTYDIQDSHSGNMAVRIKDETGAGTIVITASGSQKGDLEPEQICFLSAEETDYGYYKASSETDIHRRILDLPGTAASMHAHTKELAIATLDDRPKPGRPEPFVPVDPLGWHALGARIPVDWFAAASGSPEMAERIPRRLARHPAAIVQGHGTFARGRTLKEAFHLLCVANNAGQVVNEARRLKVDVEDLRSRITAAPRSFFGSAPDPYEVEDDERCDFPEETEIRKEFRKAGARIFESRLSPFHTGSMSLRGVGELLYTAKASMPRDLPGPLRRLSIRPDGGDSPELARHKAIYAETDFQTVMHCYVPEAEAHAYFRYPGEDRPADRVVPVDAEGGFMDLVIPVLPATVDTETLIKNLHDYKVAIVRGGGVWAVGHHSLSEVLHHPSSVREICLYRIGAFERGLDLRKMEPAKARNW